MKNHKLIAGIIGLAVQFMLLITYAKSQEDEGLAVVTAEMFGLLQSEINVLNSNMGTLQEELQALAARIQNVAANTNQASNLELEELNLLISVSNRQEEEISKLVYSNGIWQQNFRVINSTFEKLRKVVVFPIPTINNAPQIAAAIRRVLPSVTQRNTTIIRTPTLKPLQSFKNVTKQT